MYNYQNEKHKIFTEEGQEMFLKIRDEAHRLLNVAGAFSLFNATKNCSGEVWAMMACVDRLVELGEIVEIANTHTFSDARIFIAI